MSVQLQQIASRIRDLREIAGLSQAEAAQAFGIATETYAAYEGGDQDFPVSLLYQIAGKFGVELTAILTGDEPRLHEYCLVRKGRGVDVERREEYKYQSLAYNFIHKKAEPFLVTAEPDGDEIHFNRHPGQEFNFVLKGTLRIVLDGHELVLETGDSLYFDATKPHGMQAVGEAPAQFLAIIL
jgi:transcriptional regulator with XRE-family HTH domain